MSDSPHHVDRIEWIDVARGIGIILVVLAHALRGLIRAEISTPNAALLFVDRFIYSFHMPLFFFLGGLFADRLKSSGYLQTLSILLKTIAWPYFVWSTVQTLLMLLMPSGTNHPVAISQLWSVLVWPEMQFWFLYAYFIISLAFAALTRLPVGFSGCLAIAVVIYLAPTLFLHWPPLVATQKYLVYFCMGAALFPVTKRLLEKTSQNAALFVSGVGFSVLAMAIWQGFNSGAVMALLIASVGIVSTCSFATCASGYTACVLGYVGKRSLEIYVAHSIASAGIRVVLRTALGIDQFWVHAIAGTVVGLIAPLVFAEICKRLKLRYVFRFA